VPITGIPWSPLHPPLFFRSTCHGSVGDSGAPRVEDRPRVKTCEMDGGAVGATVADGGGGGSGEGL